MQLREIIGLIIVIPLALFMLLIFLASMRIYSQNKPVLPRFDDEQQRIEDEEVYLNDLEGEKLREERINNN